MANPQKENGNVGIANEIFDVLCRTRIPGEARQVLDVILRQTYGWQKKKDGIALKTFCAKTGMKKPAVCRAIKTLREMNLIIIEKDNAEWNIYEFNKDFTTWKSLSKKITLSKKIINVIEKDNLPLSKKIPSINNYSKNTISNSLVPTSDEVGDPPKKIKKVFFKFSREILLSIHLFETIQFNNPNFKVPNFQNWASEVDKMLRIDKRTPDQIDYLIHWSQKDKFWFKNILSMSTLREKFDRLVMEVKSDHYKIMEEKKKKELQEMNF